jgi:hypothetical protein
VDGSDHTLVRRYSESEEAFYRNLIFPEEERRQFTTTTWDGNFRWFRSPNIIPIEKYRRPTPAVLPGRPAHELARRQIRLGSHSWLSEAPAINRNHGRARNKVKRATGLPRLLRRSMAVDRSTSLNA